jgi:hypothetical protein
VASEDDFFGDLDRLDIVEIETVGEFVQLSGVVSGALG